MYKQDYKNIGKLLTVNYCLNFKSGRKEYISKIIFEEEDVVLYTKDNSCFSLKTIAENELVLEDGKAFIYDRSTIEKKFLVVDNHEKTMIDVLNKSQIFLTNYKTLFDKMDEADKSGMMFSKYFWHYLPGDNLAEIINCGYFKSRTTLHGRIPFDIKEKIEVSNEVQSRNKSLLTQKHVRFYLRPLNAPFFLVFNNISDYQKMHFAIVRINRDALSLSKNPTFLYFRNAQSAKDYVYDDRYKLNGWGNENFKMRDLNLFSFNEIYSKYDPQEDYLVKLNQQAEFLVKDKIGIGFIDKIYFYSKEGLLDFLEKISSSPWYNKIKSKCLVYRGYFGY